MNVIKATWSEGRIVPAVPIQWPDGTQLWIAPVSENDADMQGDDELWEDTPESFSKWKKQLDSVEPKI